MAIVSALIRVHVHAASGRIDPLGLVPIGIALTLGRALVMPGAEKALALNLHRQFERAREHPGEITRARFDQLFQDCLNCRIFPSVHLLFSMVVQQLHGIPQWAARAGARPSTGSWPHLDQISRLQVTVPTCP